MSRRAAILALLAAVAGALVWEGSRRLAVDAASEGDRRPAGSPQGRRPPASLPGVRVPSKVAQPQRSPHWPGPVSEVVTVEPVRAVPKYPSPDIDVPIDADIPETSDDLREPVLIGPPLDPDDLDSELTLRATGGLHADDTGATPSFVAQDGSR